MKKRSNSFILLCFLLCFFSCFSDINHKKTVSTLNSLYGKKIDFFNKDVYYVNSRDTVIYSVGEFDYTIVMYGHPSNCETCSWKLDEWYLKRKEILFYNKNVDMKFILQTDDYDEVGHYILHAMPDVPLIYDSRALFIKNNHLPDEAKYHSFLLDSENKIVLVGSPIGNDKLWDMYKEIIINNDSYESEN